YDPVFVPYGDDRTAAQLSPADWASGCWAAPAAPAVPAAPLRLVAAAMAGPAAMPSD
ncbi:AI-2E family transporter, partial [Mycobacterium tuberculosis]